MVISWLVRLQIPTGLVGDELVTEVVPSLQNSDVGLITQKSPLMEESLQGTIGLGDAPWKDEFSLPRDRVAVPEAEERPFLGPERSQQISITHRCRCLFERRCENLDARKDP